MFTVKFQTINAAFEDEGIASEIARILRRIASQVEDGVFEAKVLDANGNTVGEWVYTDDRI